MSAVTTPATALRAEGPGRLPPGRYPFWGVVASEWTKLRTVRSTPWTLLVTVVLGVGLGAIACTAVSARWTSMSLLERATFDPTRASLTGVLLAQLAVGVLGVLVLSAEYGTGTIRATFAAVPRRPLVLVAKTLVFGSTALLVGLLVAFAAFFVGQSLLTGPAPHAALGQAGVLRSVIGAALYLTVLGLLALGLAAIIRHTAGAISAFVGILLILPLIVAALPTSYSRAIGKFLPANIGVTLLSATPQPNSFSAWTGFAVLCGYALLALLVGGILLARRDA